MEENAIIFNNAAVLVSAGAAAISAIFAGLAFLFSRKLSRRDMVDILKVEILQVVSSVQGRKAWIETVELSKIVDSQGIAGPRADRLAGLLGVRTNNTLKSWLKIKSKYETKKWLWLIPVALEELKREGYENLLRL